jgi:signal transduction histidine kinase
MTVLHADPGVVTSRLRLKLTAVFAVAMAAVLLASGVFVYLRVNRELLAAVDRDLGARSDALIGTLAADPGVLLAGTHRFADPDEAFAQVLDRSGQVVDATPGLPAQPLLEPAELTDLTAPRFLTRAGGRGADQQRLLAVPATIQGVPRVVVVGATLGDRNDALGQLLAALVLVGIVATALASGGAWLLAGVALAPVDAAVRRERRLVDDASHELRTPLAVVKAELDLALARPRDPDELRRTIHVAARETDRLVRLTEDLLVVARQRQGVLPVRAQPTRLTDLVDSSVAPLQAAAVTTGRTVQTQVDDVVVGVDPERVRQVLVNLVDNALKHGRGRVSVRAAVDEGLLRLEVADEGDGLAQPSGGGLGLAIVRGIAAACGGRVTDYHDLDGTGVRVELPVAG